MTTVMPADRTFAFALPAAERERLRRLLAETTGFSRRSALLLTVIQGVQLGSALSFQKQSAFIAIYGIGFAVMLAILILVLLRRRRFAVAFNGSLEIVEAGLVGTLDSASAFVRWSDIAGARDTGTAIVVLRRRGASAIAIPKASLGDAAAFWALLEDRLIAKRGLLLSAAPRKQITNSAS